MNMYNTPEYTPSPFINSHISLHAPMLDIKYFGQIHDFTLVNSCTEITEIKLSLNFKKNLKILFFWSIIFRLVIKIHLVYCMFPIIMGIK